MPMLSSSHVSHATVMDRASANHFVAVVGPEYLGRNFDVTEDSDTREAFGEHSFAAGGHHGMANRSSDSEHDEKRPGSADRKEDL